MQIRSLRTRSGVIGLGIALAALAAVAALAVAQASARPATVAAAAQQPDVLDHFKCYGVKGTPLRTQVFLTDQFGAAPAMVQRPLLLCNPVEKQVGGLVTPIQDPAAHLKCYGIRTKRLAVRQVRVRNQFGIQTLAVGRPVVLCAPASKTEGLQDPGPPPVDLDHFKCYRVKGRPIAVPVVLRDQFRVEEARVRAPALLCNPVEKRRDNEVTPIRFPERHLVCYTLEPRQQVRISVVTRTQFGREPLRVTRSLALCAPSEKEG
jgi:hypothetical protein